MKKEPKLAIAVIALAAVMLVAASAELAITGYAFAYNNGNQATSQADACGNGQEPTNVGCQNTNSQIQGDENSAALVSQQTFPSADTCGFEETPTEGTIIPEQTAPSTPSATQLSATDDEPCGFQISGNSNFLGGGTCIEASPDADPIPFEVEFLLFSARTDSNGKVSGSYSFFIVGSNISYFGQITDGTTDGSTYTLSGIGNGVCPLGSNIIINGDVTFSGDCSQPGGPDVTINYKDFSGGSFATNGFANCNLT